MDGLGGRNWKPFFFSTQNKHAGLNLKSYLYSFGGMLEIMNDTVAVAF